MIDVNARPPAENRLRRWWRSVSAAIAAADGSGYEHVAQRVDALEERVRRLEAPLPSTPETPFR